MAFTFKKVSPLVRVDDAIWGQLVKAAHSKLHGDIQFVECFDNGRFRVKSAKRGDVEMGDVRLSHLLAKDIAEEPARRERFQAEQRLRQVARTRPDLVKAAEIAVEAYNEEAKGNSLLEPIGEATHAKEALLFIDECLQAEAEGLERVRKGFSTRKGVRA